MTKIEWVKNAKGEQGKTWNPVVGCSIVSPGCTNCYAMKMAGRLALMGSAPHYKGTTKAVNGNTVWTGKLAQAPESTLLEPLRRKKPTMYFVNSMGDLFHEDCPDEWIDRVFAVMALCPQHTFQVLTKRGERMRAYMTGPHRSRWASFITKLIAERKLDAKNHKAALATAAIFDLPALRNVWLGVSTEDQKRADERIPLLLQTPAAVRFISAEPLLGPINLKPYLTGHEDNGISADWKAGGCIAWTPPLDWVIVGGESGAGARPMHPQWARDLRDQCSTAGVSFFFKQWGEWIDTKAHDNLPLRKSHHWDDDEISDLVGKSKAGRLLDGKEHNAFPKVNHA